jgi:hypothetical protein
MRSGIPWRKEHVKFSAQNGDRVNKGEDDNSAPLSPILKPVYDYTLGKYL